MFRIIATIAIFAATLRYVAPVIAPPDFPHPFVMLFGYLIGVGLLVGGIANLYQRHWPQRPKPANFSYLPSAESRAEQHHNLLNWIILLLLLLLCRGI